MVATKNGVRNMKRWYTEIPEIKKAAPELQVLSCHDEWLLPTMFDVDGLLVGYGNIAPELLIQLIEAGKAQDYPEARRIFEQLLPVTKAVYHRGSHMEGTVALKLGLVKRRSGKSSPPLTRRGSDRSPPRPSPPNELMGPRAAGCEDLLLPGWSRTGPGTRITARMTPKKRHCAREKQPGVDRSEDRRARKESHVAA